VVDLSNGCSSAGSQRARTAVGSEMAVRRDTGIVALADTSVPIGRETLEALSAVGITGLCCLRYRVVNNARVLELR
jgi:hypothetical protein